MQLPQLRRCRGRHLVSRTVTVHNLGCEPVNFTQATFYDADECGTPPMMPCDTAAQADTYVSWFSLSPGPAGADSRGRLRELHPSVPAPGRPRREPDRETEADQR